MSFRSNNANLFMSSDIFLFSIFQINQPVDKITLNSVDLKIQKATVKVDSTVIESIETIYLPESEVVNLLFKEPLPASQKAILEMEFTGELNDKMKGFYRSKYFTSTGEERFAGVTQFEATDARRAFPCWVSHMSIQGNRRVQHFKYFRMSLQSKQLSTSPSSFRRTALGCRTCQS